MINGYFEFNKLEDVQAYINDVLDPDAQNNGKEISFVVIERKTYDIFPIHKRERDTFYDLSPEAKESLKQRADRWVLAAQQGVDPLLTEVKAYIDVYKVCPGCRRLIYFLTPSPPARLLTRCSGILRSCLKAVILIHTI